MDKKSGWGYTWGYIWGYIFALAKTKCIVVGLHLGLHFALFFFVFDPTNFQKSGKNKVFCVFSRGKITKRTVFAAHF